MSNACLKNLVSEQNFSNTDCLSILLEWHAMQPTNYSAYTTRRDAVTGGSGEWYISYAFYHDGAEHGSGVGYHNDDVMKWKRFPRYWPFVRGIHRSPVNSAHKGQWRGALMSSLICAWINDRVNNREAGHLRRHRAYYDVNLMLLRQCWLLRHHQYGMHCMLDLFRPALRGRMEIMHNLSPRIVIGYNSTHGQGNKRHGKIHYDDVTMSGMASQITSLAIVYSTVYPGADQRKHQSPASLAFVREIHRGPVNSPHKWPVTRKMFPFDDVIMIHRKGNDIVEKSIQRCKANPQIPFCCVGIFFQSL